MSPKTNSLIGRVSIFVACLAANGAHAETKFRALSNAIGCFEADKLQQAEDAMKSHDRTQMDILNCFPISSGTAAIIIDGGTESAQWHVRLDPDGPSPMDIWARASSFARD